MSCRGATCRDTYVTDDLYCSLMTMDHFFMFIIRNIPEQKYFADIKLVNATADSPDLSDSVAELAYSMLKSFTPHMGITVEERNILVYISQYICYKVLDLHVINVK